MNPEPHFHSIFVSFVTMIEREVYVYVYEKDVSTHRIHVFLSFV